MHRQRRLTATLLLAIVAGLVPAVVVLAFTAPARADAVRAVRPPLTVVVGQGDTLWDLTLAHAPSTQDPMAYVAEVTALNDVKATALEPGMVLRLP
ncbi:MAG: LysM peptidoglycan-binding domain-containing protein [Egibacteraceae bacterium]